MGQPNTTPDLLRPMGIGDILDGAIKLYRNNFLLLIGIGACVYIPLCLLGFVVSQGIFNVLIQLISIFLAAVVTVAISERILSREISIADSYRRTSSRLVSLAGAILLIGLIAFVLLIAVGLFMGIFSALFLRILHFPFSSLIFILLISLFTVAIMVWLLFIPQTILLEGKKATESFGRNMDLIRDNFWKAFAVMILVSIATFIVTSFLWLIGGIAVTILDSGSSTDRGFAQNFGAAVDRFRQFPLSVGMINLLLQPFRMVVITLLYYDIRVRKEGYDLEVMAKELAIEATSEYESGEAREEAEIIHCPKCGKENEYTATFCIACGNRLSTQTLMDSEDEQQIASTEQDLKKMNVLLLIFLVLITGGIYLPIWYLRRLNAINNLQSGEKLSSGIFAAVIVLFVMGLLIIISGSEAYNIPHLVAGIILLVQRFKVLRIFTEHFNIHLKRGIAFSGLATFFLGEYYLQYKINGFNA